MKLNPISAAWRDTILLVSGLGFLLFEVVVRTGEPRWGLLPMYGWMMGLPVMLNKDASPSSAPPPPIPPSPPGEAVP